MSGRAGAVVELAAEAFQALPASTVVLDPGGVVVLANEAWRTFGRANGGRSPYGVGTCYLEVCRRAAADGDPLGDVVEAALQAVLDGHAPQAALDYPCHSPSRQRWFSLTAQPLPEGHVLVQHEEISNWVQERARLVQAATHDPLTGLPGRALLEERLASALSHTDRRADATVAVLVVDLDVSGVDARYGPLAADALLAVVGRRLGQVGRAWDTVARLAADEFVLVLPGCTQQAAEVLRDRVARTVTQPVPLGAGEVTVTARVGAALAGRGSDLAELLTAARTDLLRPGG